MEPEETFARFTRPLRPQFAVIITSLNLILSFIVCAPTLSTLTRSTYRDSVAVWPRAISVCNTFLRSSSHPNFILTIAPNAYAICTPPNSIYTVNDNHSTADCMLVENGVILAVGSVGTLNIHR